MQTILIQLYLKLAAINKRKIKGLSCGLLVKTDGRRSKVNHLADFVSAVGRITRNHLNTAELYFIF